MKFDSNALNDHRRSDALNAQTSKLNAQTVGVDFDQQRLRILRCTARAMAGGAGGLRFRPGTRVWLDGLTPALFFRTSNSHTPKEKNHE